MIVAALLVIILRKECIISKFTPTVLHSTHHCVPCRWRAVVYMLSYTQISESIEALREFQV